MPLAKHGCKSTQFISYSCKKWGNIVHESEKTGITKVPLRSQRVSRWVTKGMLGSQRVSCCVTKVPLGSQDGACCVTRVPLGSQDGVRCVTRGVLGSQDGVRCVTKGVLGSQDGVCCVTRGVLGSQDGSCKTTRGSPIAQRPSCRRWVSRRPWGACRWCPPLRCRRCRRRGWARGCRRPPCRRACSTFGRGLRWRRAGWSARSVPSRGRTS